MKYLKLTFALTWLMCGSLWAQNTYWSLPPKYYEPVGDNIQSLPQPQQTFDPWEEYTGDTAQWAHAAYTDPNGELLFFVIDDKVYDKNGYVVDFLRDNLTVLTDQYTKKPWSSY